MKRMKWVSLVVFVLLVISLGLLSGCGGTSTKTTVAQDIPLLDLSVGTAGNDSAYIVSNTSGGSDSARFVDGTSELIYKFDLPDSATAGTLTLNIGNEYLVSLSKDNTNWTEVLRETNEVRDCSNQAKRTIDITSFLNGNATKTIYLKLGDTFTGDGWGSYLTHISLSARVVPQDVTRVLDLSVGTSGNDASYIVTDAGGNNAGSRFADGTSTLIYKFSLPTSADGGTMILNIGNEYLVSLSKDGTNWTEVLRETKEVKDNSNLGEQKVNITPYLTDNSTKTVYLKLGDAFSGDGWGGWLTHITIATYRF